MIKKCKKCRVEKPHTAEFFHRHSKKKDGTDYLHPECRTCRNRYLNQRYKDPEVRKEQNEYYKEYNRNRRAVDPSYKIRGNLSTRIYLALRDGSKSDSMLNLLGCSIEELWRHLESQFTDGMTRSNYGEWHVDHIKPCCSFDLSDELQQRKCFHYSNLQPLWAKDNLRKSGKH